MIALVAAIAVLGIVLGTVAQIPPSLSAAAAVLIGAWLLGFVVRERLARRASR
ncbi:hypothetical protein [Streptomyces sp. NPDC059176]|uniref:hypothetical protein n=1 Tax=unclassified Streptomyces TaxID=2593676 RepID=UPI00367F16BD